MPKVKGSTFLARLAFLDSRFGDKGKQKVLAALSQSDREFLSGKILPATWYDRNFFGRFVDTIDQELGKGDHRLTRLMGYYAADLQLNGAYDAFIRHNDPSFLLSRANSVWQIFHDFGHIEILLEGKSRCRLWLKDLKFSDVATVEGIIGWTLKGLELSGCQEIRFRYDPHPTPTKDAYRILVAWRMQ